MNEFGRVRMFRSVQLDINLNIVTSWNWKYSWVCLIMRIDRYTQLNIQRKNGKGSRTEGFMLLSEEKKIAKKTEKLRSGCWRTSRKQDASACKEADNFIWSGRLNSIK